MKVFWTDFISVYTISCLAQLNRDYVCIMYQIIIIMIIIIIR